MTTTIRLSDGHVLIAGAFDKVNGVPRANVARLNGDGSVDEAFNPGSLSGGIKTAVFAMALQLDGKVLIGGTFTNVNGVPRNRIARLHEDGSLDETFDPGFGITGNDQAAVYALAVQTAAGKILVAGDFDFVNNTNRFGIARLNFDGSLDPGFVPNAGGPAGAYYALALQADGKLVAGGVGKLARFAFSGNLDPSFNAAALPASNTVYALALQKDGKVLVGIDHSGVTRLLTNGAPDSTFNAGITNGMVRAIALHNCGTLLVGGSFGGADSTPLRHLARLQTDGTLDAAFASETIDAAVWCVTVQTNNLLLLGGDFTHINGGDGAGVARLQGDQPTLPAILSQPVSQSITAGQDALLTVGVVDCPETLFQWELNGTNVPGATNAQLFLPNVHQTNAGSYTAVVTTWLGATSSQPATLSVSLEPRNPGSPDIDFYLTPGGFGRINALAAQGDGRLVIGGVFTSPDGTTTNRVARLNHDGSFDATFYRTPRGIGEVKSVAVQPDGKILFAGSFSYYFAPIPFPDRIGRFGVHGDLDIDFLPNLPSPFFSAGANDVVNCVAVQGDGKILIGGAFTRVGSFSRGGIARLLTDGSVDAAYNPAGVAGVVLAGAVQMDNKIIVGGTFTSVGLMPRARVARLNTDGSVDLSFDPGSGANNSVNAVAIGSDGRILLGGAFTRVNGIARNHIARLNEEGSVDPAFDPGAGPNLSLFAVAVQSDGKILIGGSFQSVAGTPRNHIARLNADGGLDPSFDPGQGANNQVFALAVENSGKTYAAGSFTQYNGLTRDHVARLNGDLVLFDPVIEGESLSFSLSTFTGQAYMLEYTDFIDHPDWLPLRTVIGDGMIQKLSDQRTNTQSRYYRVRRE